MADDTTRATAYTSQEETPTDAVVTLRIRPDLNDKISAASDATSLKRADIMRLALDRGIDRLLEQLEAKIESPN